MRAIAIALALAVTSCGYGAGSFSGGGAAFVGRRVQLGCLDVAVAPTGDDRADGLLLAFSFGNRCGRPAVVDFTQVQAVGRYGDGTRPLHAYDPRHELRPLRIAGGDVAREVIAYQGDDGGAPTAACVDLGALEQRTEATAHWVCFGAWDVGQNRPFEAIAPAPTSAAASAQATGWPLPPEPDPVVVAMPVDAQRDVASVGAYLAARIADRKRLVKALHDYVIRRLTYDEEARRAGDRRPSQDADAVFARRFAVCAGYANLMTALGRAAGVDIQTVEGNAAGGDDDGNHAHAWNVARLDDGWVLIDTTWDGGDRAHPSSQYLMAPPALFARDHQPYDPSWRLVAPELAVDRLFVDDRQATAR
jgi:hypothetical protein